MPPVCCFMLLLSSSLLLDLFNAEMSLERYWCEPRSWGGGGGRRGLGERGG